MSVGELWRRLVFFFRRERLDRELAEEMEHHLAMKERARVERGMPPEQARHAARREFGNALLLRERSRDAWGWGMVETLLQDLRYGVRMLRRSPGFTIVAVLTLALGIGANTAIFSVLEGVTLAPLPYRHSDRLVVMWESIPRSKFVQTDSYQNFRDWQREARSFREMAAWHAASRDLSNPGATEHVGAAEVTPGFLATLGVDPVLGRDFTAQENRPVGSPVVIISNRLWKTRFGGRADALGKPVTLDGVDYTIVGVLPARFRFLRHADVYTPLGQSYRATVFTRAAHAGILVIARLKAGVGISQAQSEMDTIQSHLDDLYPKADRGLGVKLFSLKTQIVGQVGGTLLLLLGAVGLVLLIACANVASLLLARSTTRSREFAIRRALGATRARVARQLLTESALVSLVGGTLGLLIATFGTKPMVTALPEALPRTSNIGVNSSVLFFTLAISILVGILVGLAPALKSSAPDLEQRLKEGDRGSTGGRQRALSSLTVFQMALTLVLLVASGLLFRTIRNLWSVNPGFDGSHVITFKVDLSPSRTKTAAGARAAYHQLLQRIRAIPGVEAASFTLLVPLEHLDIEGRFWLGAKPTFLQEAPETLMFPTGRDYLRTMGIPLLRGRFFTSADTAGSSRVVVIDSVFAHTYFPGTDPVGRTVKFAFGPCRIIGVVGHVRHWGLGKPSTYTRAQSYFSLYQLGVPKIFRRTTLVVRTSLDASDLIPAVRNALYTAGRGEPIYDVKTMRHFVADSTSSQRLALALLTAFAALALALAAIGIYGITSYSVTQRVHEIGIRMALGAQNRDVFRMVVGQGLRLASVGVAIGVAAALVLSRVLSSFSRLLYGVGPSDPATFVGVSLVLAGAAVLACYVPARRAMKVDPMEALRYE